MNLKLAVALCLALITSPTLATDIGVVGLIGGKAILVVEGSAPKVYAVGSALGNGAQLIAADHDSATININGKRQVLMMSQYVHRSASGSGNKITIQADQNGHFTTDAMINGVGVKMLVDTGATLIALSAADANRLGINYRNGRLAYSDTANGTVKVYVSKIDSIKIGDVVLNQVDVMVQDAGLPVALLGMSFLNRMDMRREGDQMTLTKRF